MDEMPVERERESKKRKRRSRSSMSDRSEGSEDGGGRGGPRTPPPPRKSSKRKRKRESSPTAKKGPRTPPESPPQSPRSSDGSSAEKESGGKRSSTGGRSTTDMAASSIDELEGMRSPCWTGALVLKKSAYAVRLYKLTGDDDLIDGRLRDPNGESVRLHVTQRLPYAAGGGASLAERFVAHSADQFAYLIAITNPNASNAADLRLADSPSRPLKVYCSCVLDVLIVKY